MDGERSMNSRVSSFTWSVTFERTTSAGSPSSLRSSFSSVITVASFTHLFLQVASGLAGEASLAPTNS